VLAIAMIAQAVEICRVLPAMVMLSSISQFAASQTGDLYSNRITASLLGDYQFPKPRPMEITIHSTAIPQFVHERLLSAVWCPVLIFLTGFTSYQRTNSDHCRSDSDTFAKQPNITVYDCRCKYSEQKQPAKQLNEQFRHDGSSISRPFMSDQTNHHPACCDCHQSKNQYAAQKRADRGVGVVRQP